jgi:hypothetical protein
MLPWSYVGRGVSRMSTTENNLNITKHKSRSSVVKNGTVFGMESRYKIPASKFATQYVTAWRNKGFFSVCHDTVQCSTPDTCRTMDMTEVSQPYCAIQGWQTAGCVPKTTSENCSKEHGDSQILLKIITNSVAQKPEGSSPHSQQPATGPCPEPVESNPHTPSQSP